MGIVRRINDSMINDRFLKKSSMINEKKLCSEAEAEAGAERYIRRLNAPECRKFFLKVMYWLPYDDRERILEASTRAHIAAPKHYFTHCARLELAKRGH